jgi:Sugar (and other) transporter
MLVGVPFVSYSSGILLVYALGSLLHWRLAAWCGLVLPMLSFMAILAAPESPTWLARKGYYDKARKGKNPRRGDSAHKALRQLTLQGSRKSK